MQATVEQYESRAGMEADLKSDKRGLALALIRKRRLASQQLVVLLIGLAHNRLSLRACVACSSGSARGEVWHRAIDPGGLGGARANACEVPPPPAGATAASPPQLPSLPLDRPIAICYIVNNKLL